MTEWQFIEDDNDFPPPDPAEPPRRLKFQRRLWPALALLLILIGLGVVALRARQADRQSALQADLTAAIFAEEALRSSPGPVTIAYLASATPAWREAYRRSFKAGPTRPGPGQIDILDLDFDGSCATVTLHLDHLPQMRAYCLGSEGWQRAPVPPTAWGHPAEVIDLEPGARLNFFPPDRAFAENLARDLGPLFAALAERAGPAPGPPFEITLTPQDLHQPLIALSERRVVLNSPWLTPDQPASGLAGEAAVRLALGELLLQRAGPALRPNSQPLPGAGRMLAASQVVLAMHFLLPEADQARLVDHWRNQLEGRWVTPLLAEWLVAPDPGTYPRAELAAKLTAYSLYRQHGPAALLALIKALPDSSGWDQLFQANLGRSAGQVEAEAAALAQADPAGTGRSFGRGATPPALPLRGSLVRPGLAEAEPSRTYLQLAGRNDLIGLELAPGQTARSAGGEALPPVCLGPAALVEVSGRWLEAGQRLQVRTITVLELDILPLGPAPAGVSAYLLSGKFYDPAALVALTEAGALQPLTTLSQTRQVFPLPLPTAQEPLHFLFKLDLPGCERAWFAHYRPEQGVTQRWLAPANPIEWVWQADRGTLLFKSEPAGPAGYEFYQAEPDRILPRLIGRSTLAQTMLGWDSQAARLISLVSQPQEAYLGLFAIPSGEMERQIFYPAIRGRRVSPDGAWLAYVISSASMFHPPNRLEIIDLRRGSFTTLGLKRIGEAFLPPVWSLNMAQPQVVTLAGPAISEELPDPIQLILTGPQHGEAPLIVAEAIPDERFTSPVICRDGAILYRVEGEGPARLLRQRPGHPPRTLLHTGQPLYPLACP
jgi:hypothetical protein